MTHTQLHEHTWNSLKGNWGKVIGGFAAYLGLSIGIELALMCIIWIPVLGMLASIASMFFLLMPLMLGTYLILWRVVTRGQTGVNFLFTFFHDGKRYMRAVGLCALNCLIMCAIAFVSFIPLMILFFVFAVKIGSVALGAFVGNPQLNEQMLADLMQRFLQSNMVGIVTALLITLLLGIFLTAFLILFFAPTYFVFLEHPDMGVSQCISWGVRCSKGYKGKLFLCWLECFGMVVVLESLLIFLCALCPYTLCLTVPLFIAATFCGMIYFSALFMTIIRGALETHMPMPQPLQAELPVQED